VPYGVVSSEGYPFPRNPGADPASQVRGAALGRTRNVFGKLKGTRSTPCSKKATTKGVRPIGMTQGEGSRCCRGNDSSSGTGDCSKRPFNVPLMLRTAPVNLHAICCRSYQAVRDMRAADIRKRGCYVARPDSGIIDCLHDFWLRQLTGSLFCRVLPYGKRRRLFGARRRLRPLCRHSHERGGNGVEPRCGTTTSAVAVGKHELGRSYVVQMS